MRERERIKPPRELYEDILERAIQEAKASPNATEAAARYGKTDVAEAIREIVRSTEDGLTGASRPDAEWEYLKTSLLESGVSMVTAVNLGHAVFEKLQASKARDQSSLRIWWQAFLDVFRNKG